MKILLHIDQQERLARGMDAPQSTQRIDIQMSEVPDDLIAAFAKHYKLKTGELIVDGTPLMVLDHKINDWRTAFRRLLAAKGVPTVKAGAQ